MYRYDNFASDALFCIEKNNVDIGELLFFIDQFLSIKKTGNNLLQDGGSRLDKPYAKSKFLTKDMEKVIVETIKMINSNFSKFQELVKEKENNKVSIEFNLFNYLDLDT